MNQADLLKENRAKGWDAVPESAPKWVKAQLIAARTAQLRGVEFRVTPQMLRAEAEYRSLTHRSTARPEKSAQSRVDAEIEAFKQKAFAQGQRIHADNRRMREQAEEQDTLRRHLNILKTIGVEKGLL